VGQYSEGLCYAFFLVAICGTGMLVVSRYRLTRERHAEIRAALDAGDAYKDIK
jgi:Na+/melibiose symporter-like transporter